MSNAELKNFIHPNDCETSSYFERIESAEASGTSAENNAGKFNQNYIRMDAASLTGEAKMP